MFVKNRRHFKSEGMKEVGGISSSSSLFKIKQNRDVMFLLYCFK